jgi:hypothetical protein
MAILQQRTNRERPDRTLLTFSSSTASVVAEADGERSLSFLGYGVPEGEGVWDR